MNPLTATQGLLGAGIPVLCYHQVRPGSGMTPEKFGSHLDMLHRIGFQTISLARLHRIISGKESAPRRCAVLTFDDCTLDNWVYAMPELVRRGMRAAFFAVTDFLVPGTARLRADQGGGEIRVPDLGVVMQQAMRGRFEGFMNHGEIRAAVRELGMEVYSHSAAHQACFTSSRQNGFLCDNRHWSHAALSSPDSSPETPVFPVGSAYAHAGHGLDWKGQPLTLGTREERLAFCIDDFSSSRNRLEDILERPCPFLCLPWGQYDECTLEAAGRSGYAAVLNLEAGYVGPGTDPMRIGRLAVKDRKSRFWLGLKTTLLAHKHLAPMVRGHGRLA